jgi:hypothetical protein
MTTIVAGNTLTNSYTVNADTTGNLVLQTNGGTTALTIDTNQNATVANSVSMAGNLTVTGKSTHVGSAVFNNTISAPNTFGFKNRIINGAMVIDQRNNGASQTPTDGAYTVDRWQYQGSASGKFTSQQLSSSPPVGFSNYLGLTVASPVTVGTTDYYEIRQKIEGFNVSDLSWGNSNGKAVTLSFWVQSSLTGTFGGSIVASTGYSYPFTYSISSANTWTYITLNIPALTTGGNIASGNTLGVQVIISLGQGSNNAGTAGSWSSNTYNSATGAVSVVGTSGATFYITGVQLEVGTQATSFDYRPYGTELALCQRYYETSYYPTAAVPTNSTGGAVVMGLGSQTYFGTSSNLTSQSLSLFSFKVNKRAAPTTTIYSYTSSTTATVSDGWTGVDKSSNSGTINTSNFQGFAIYNGSGSNITVASYAVLFHYASTAEL